MGKDVFRRILCWLGLHDWKLLNLPWQRAYLTHLVPEAHCRHCLVWYDEYGKKHKKEK